jgi:hypothetical protein
MKKQLLILLLVFLWATGNAQLKIFILIDKDKNVSIGVRDKNGPVADTAKTTGLTDAGNVFSIENETQDTNYRVSILAEPGNKSNLSIILNPCMIPNAETVKKTFGRNANLPWINNKTKSDVVLNSPISLPCKIIVQKKEGQNNYKEVKSRIILTGINNEPKINGKSIFTGIPYYDALSLASCHKISDNDAYEILNYYNGESNLTKWEDLISAFTPNNFLYHALTEEVDTNCFNGAMKSGVWDFSSLLSSAGGLDVTNIADGFAKFIVKRTKQELSIAFFDKFNEEINKFPDLKTVFPQTCRALSIIGDQIYNYEAYIQTLRESFENDLSALPTNLPGIIDNHPEFFSKFPELAATLKSGCYIAGKLRDKIHPGDILADYPVEYLDSLDLDLKGAIQTLQLISASFLDSSQLDEKYWVTGKGIKDLLKNEKAFKIYLGLLYQEAKFRYDSLHFKNTDLLQVLNKACDLWKTEYPLYKNYFSRFSEKVNKINQMVNDYKKPKNDSLAIEQYASYFIASLDFLEVCTEAGQLVPKDMLDKSTDLILRNLKTSSADYFDVARSSSQLVLDINRRNYGAAVINAVNIYNLIYAKFVEHTKDSLDKTGISSKKIKENRKIAKETRNLLLIKQDNHQLFQDEFLKNEKLLEYYSLDRAIILSKNVTDRQINDFRTKLLKDTLKFDTISKIIVEGDLARARMKKLFTYGTFMATIVQAKSSDDIEKAIESFALPPGSARIKREAPFNVSLNAYCGLFLGYERITGIDPCWSLKYRAYNSFGITAPIGIALSRGHSVFFIGTGKKGWTNNSKSAGWSSSVFISVIDIGAITAFRFTDDSTQQAPTILLEDIISPGIFFSLGIPRTPLSVNMGWQMGPLLREITAKTTTYKNNYTRISISLCVDIPILNFYSKPKK